MKPSALVYHRRGKVFAAFLIVLTCIALLLTAGDSNTSTTQSSWATSVGLDAARNGACSAVLPGGDILITGGHGANSTLNSAQLFSAKHGSKDVSPMSYARANHACSALPDGRVLVAGGTVTGNAPTNTAEVFDPKTGAWTILSPMTVPRSGVGAVTLPNGRVLIAGGMSSGTPTATLEFFDTATNSFTPVTQILSSPRSDHATVVMKDGRVLIAGGSSDGKNALATTDIYDPATGKVTAGPNMSTLRSGLAASTLLDGRIYLSGGTDGKKEQASAEIYDPVKGTITPAPDMLTARAGHMAIRVPNNNSILIIGGSHGDGVTGDVELFIPWQNRYKALGSGPGVANHIVAALRGNAAGVAHALRSKSSATNTTSTAPATARTISTLGTDCSASATDGSALPAVCTDQFDYSPGETAYITGSGWPANTKIDFNLSRSDGTSTTWSVFTDANGSLTDRTDLTTTTYNLYTTYNVVSTDAGLSFTLTATVYGATDITAQNQATIGFTDSSINTYDVPCPTGNNPTSVTSFTLGQQVCAISSGGGNISSSQIQWINGAGTVKFTANSTSSKGFNDTEQPDSTGTWTVKWIDTSHGTPGTLIVSNTFSVIGKTTPSFSNLISPTVTYGQSASASGKIGSASPYPTGSVSVAVNGAKVQAPINSADGSFTASFASLPANATGFTVTYQYGGDANYSAATDGTSTLIVNPAPVTITAKSTSKIYGQTVTFAGTEFTTSGLVNGDTVTSVMLTSAGAAATAAAAGSPYSIVPSAATGTGLTNYTINYANGTLTVNLAALTITAKNTSKTYGQTITFAGTEFTTSGLVNGDTATSVTLTSAGAAATATVTGSPYDIIPSAAVGTGLSNYAISYVNGTLTVKAASLTITANNDSKTYGQTKSYGAESTAFTATGLQNSETIGSVTLASTGGAATAGVGTYAITPSAATGGTFNPSNYTVTYKDGTLTVNAAPLTITAKNAGKTYGQTSVFAGTEFTTNGLLNSDTVTSVTLTSGGAAATAPVGAYSIAPSAAVGTGLSNYTIAYANGTLTVSPAPLIITAKDASKTYGQTLTFTGTEFTASGLLNGDGVTSVALASDGAAASADVNTYAITPGSAVGTGLSNYTIQYKNGTLTVTQATPVLPGTQTGSGTYGVATTLTVTIGAVNGGAIPTGTVAFQFTLNGKTYNVCADGTLQLQPAMPACAVALDNTGTAKVTTSVLPAGADNITATYSGNGDYLGGTTALNFTISQAATQAELTVNPSNPAPTYGDTVMLTAKVTSVTSGIPSGSVQFAYSSDNGAHWTNIGSAATLDNTGQVQIQTAALPAGSPKIQASYSGDPNFQGVSVNVTQTVNKKTLTVNGVTASDKTYDGTTSATINTSGASLIGAVSGDDVQLVTSGVSGTFADANVGAGKSVTIAGLTITGTAASNYSLTQPAATASINAAPLTITANSTSKTYGQAITFAGTEFTTSGLQNGETIGSVTLASSGAAVTAAVGGYDIVPSAATGGTFNPSNYSITYKKGTLTVNQAALTITASNDSKTYGQTKSYGAGSTAFTATGLQNSETIGSVTLASTGGAASAAVGTYAITPGAATGGTFNPSNYTITYKDGTLTVNAAALTITANNDSKTYGQTKSYGAESTAFTATGLQNSETIGSVTLASTGGAATAGVGTYAITPSAATGGTFNPSNYTVTYKDGTLTVNAAALTITANNDSKTYGQTKSYGAGSTAFTATGLQNSETIGSVTLASTGGAATAGVGTYAITPSAATGGTFNPSNYTITYKDGTLTVNAAALTITANNDSKTYGQTKSYGAGSTAFAATGLQNSETIGSVTLASTGGAATAGVGTYAITPSAATGGTFNPSNYSITYKDGTLTVNAAALTITANNDSKTYGQTKSYGAGSTAFTATGLQNSETIGSVTLASTGGAATAPVGGYAITPSAATGGTFNPSNYTITYKDGTLTVNAAALTITANNDSKTYGQAKSYGAGSTAFAATGLQNSEAIGSVTLASIGAAPTAAVGGYAITPSAATGGTFNPSNYTITYKDGTLTVNAAALTITANNDSKTYGQTKSYGAGSTAFTATGLQNSETIGSVTLASTGGAATAGVGTYAITPSAATGGTFSSSNYSITYNSGTLTVNQASATVTADNKSRIYGAANPTLTATVTGTANGDSLNYTLATTATATSGVGPYPIMVTLGSNPNYTVTPTNGTLTITAASATVIADNKSRGYGAANPTLTATVAGTVNGDSLNYTLATTATTASGVGPYPIMVTLGSNPNYTVTPTNGTLTINAATTNTAVKSVLSSGIAPVTVTLTATVSNIVTSPIPSGSVIFRDTSNNNAVVGGGAVTLSNGTATVTLTVGKDLVPASTGTMGQPHVIQAVYTPDTANFVGAISPSNAAPVLSITQPDNNYAPQAVKTPIQFSATYSGFSVTSAQWSFDTTTATGGTPNAGTITGQYAFTNAGVYAIMLTANDGSGGIAIANLGVQGMPLSVVIYDPNAGFVTGGGWIMSPTGAFPANTTLTGKATFGFVSKYQKGASTPTGETEFNFQVANFDFHSTTYSWLVVSGSQAQYKGTGTINGKSTSAGDYQFILTARDGALASAGTPDGFRIKITDPSNSNAVVYDNLMGATDSTANTQNISGGSIVIHSN